MKSAWQGWASGGSGVHTRGKGGSSWRRRSPKRGRKPRATPALPRVAAVNFVQKHLEGETHLCRLIYMTSGATLLSSSSALSCLSGPWP